MVQFLKKASLLIIGSSLSVLISHSSSAETVTIDRLEASVNAATVLLSDVVQFRKTLQLRSQLDPLFQGTNLASRLAKSSDGDAVDFLVNEKMISEQFTVGEPEVEQEINSIQATNQLDRAQLRSLLKSQGFNFEDYFELIRASIGKRNLLDRDIRTKVQISEDDVKNYFYAKSSSAQSTTFQFHLKLITLTSATYKGAEGARVAANRVQELLRSGETFEEVAQNYSDHPSKQNGGDLGFLSEEEMSGPIRARAKKLKVGEVSEILGNETSGLFILKLVDLKSGQEEKLAHERDQIRNSLLASEYQHQVELWIQRQRQKTFIHFAGTDSLPSTYVQ